MWPRIGHKHESLLMKHLMVEHYRHPYYLKHTPGLFPTTHELER